MKKLCEERTQMYADKIQDAVAVMPGGDLIFAIAALKMFTEAIQKIDPKATHMAQRLFDGMSYSSKSGTFNANMTEAAARAYADTLKKKIKSSCTGIHEPGFRHLRQLQYNKYNTQAAECQFRQE